MKAYAGVSPRLDRKKSSVGCITNLSKKQATLQLGTKVAALSLRKDSDLIYKH